MFLLCRTLEKKKSKYNDFDPSEEFEPGWVLSDSHSDCIALPDTVT